MTGIVAGTGKPDAKYAGIAPGVSILSLKVLDQDGKGSIGDIIAAMDWVCQEPKALQHQGCQHVGGCRYADLVLDRPSDASGQGVWSIRA